MTWPLPIVCVSSKTTYHLRRCPPNTIVFKALVNKIVIFISLKERTYRNYVFSAFVILSLNLRYLLVDDSLSFSLSHRVVYQRQYSFSNVIHANKKANRYVFRY